jgi:hypothetical protein
MDFDKHRGESKDPVPGRHAGEIVFDRLLIEQLSPARHVKETSLLDKNHQT